MLDPVYILQMLKKRKEMDGLLVLSVGENQ
jgi:hypothetical protein